MRMSQNFKMVSETMYIGIGNVNTMPVDINVYGLISWIEDELQYATVI